MQQTNRLVYYPAEGIPYLDLSHYQFQKIIQHNRSLIYLYKDKQGNLYALKECSLTKISQQMYRKHTGVLKKVIGLKNKNVVEYISVCIKQEVQGYGERNMLILMRYYEKNLWEYIQGRKVRNEGFTLEEVMDFVRQMVGVLAHLEDIGLAHRDIKPQNIMVILQGEDVVYKLIDFEESLSPDYWDKSPPMTTFQFSSYALINQIRTNVIKVMDPFKLDTFALGITILYVCSLGRFNPKDRVHLQSKDSDLSFINQSRRKCLKQYKNADVLTYMLKQMLEVDQFKRDDFLTLKIRLESVEGEKLESVQGSDGTSTTVSLQLRQKKASGVLDEQMERQRLLIIFLILLQVPIFLFFSIH